MTSNTLHTLIQKQQILWVYYRKQEPRTPREQLGSTLCFLAGVRVTHLFNFTCYVVCIGCLRFVLCASVSKLSIFDSLLGFL